MGLSDPVSGNATIPNGQAAKKTWVTPHTGGAVPNWG